jgi:hypothetical protein
MKDKKNDFRWSTSYRLITIYAMTLLNVGWSLWLLRFYESFNTNDSRGPHRMENTLNGVTSDSKNIYERTSIGYAISITSCPTNSTNMITIDGPAILSHSIHQIHSHLNYSALSKYRNYSLYAIIHPDAERCTKHLVKFGFHPLLRSVPVNVTNITSPRYRYLIETDGCCGSREFLKLWSFTLVQHDIVVHMDVDGFLQRPLDVIFDTMLRKNYSYPELDTSDSFLEPRFRSHLGFRELSRIDFAFTRDYNQQSKITADPQRYGVQGGFFVLRPSWKTFHEMSTLLHLGNYTLNKGWGKLYFGGYYGSPQIQGFLSYYFTALYPQSAIELNRCYHNAMLDDPHDISGRCKSGQISCQDCREVPLSEMFFVHLTLCWKPWQVRF